MSIFCSRLVVHRSDQGGVVEGVAEPPAFGLLNGCEEVVVHPRVDEDTFGRAADLAGAEEAAEDGALRGGLEIGVRTDDDGPVPARLDERPLQSGGPHDLGGRVRADEAHAVDVLVLDEALADPASP